MMIGAGVWFALVGAIAAVAGLSGIRQSRRLRRDGVSVWAVAVPPSIPAGEQPDWPPHRTMIQYALADGQVMERISPRPARKAAMLRPGQRVLVWYDPADPQDVLVYGREGQIANRLFVAAGVLFFLIGAGLALFVS
jgi:Protein of unknown function (DUF3592)/Mu transposase, C-terminal